MLWEGDRPLGGQASVLGIGKRKKLGYGYLKSLLRTCTLTIPLFIFLSQIIHLILHKSKKILKRSEGVTKKKSPSSVMGEEKQDSWRWQQKMRWL